MTEPTSTSATSWVTDPSFRCAAALVHAEHRAVLELHLRDGRRAPVSHDPAFAPVLSPCHLRLALARAAVGEPPAWLDSVAGWELGGPFLEPLGGGVLAHRGPGQRIASFATPLVPLVVRELAERIGEDAAGADALTVRLRSDPAVGATTVGVTGPPGGLVDLAAVTLAASCRDRERVLRTAARA